MLLAYSHLDLTYDTNALLLDRRGQVASVVSSADFTTFRVNPENVVFDHPTRSAMVSPRNAYVRIGGEQDTRQVMDAFFRILQTSGLKAILTIKMTVFYAIPVPNAEISDLVSEHDKTLSSQRRFRPSLFGTVTDTATIWSVSLPTGRLLSFQYGPMSQEQWRGLGGEKVIPIEPTLPKVSWGAGIYDSVPWSKAGSLQETRIVVDATFSEWKTFILKSMPGEVT